MDSSLRDRYLKELSNYSQDNQVIFFDSPTIMVGSTDIREKIKQGLNVDYLLPEKVSDYIKQKGLYQNG